MDPITLAAVTAALTVLATECGKGAASQAGKDLWSKAKSLFGWTKDPELPDLSIAIAERLQNDKKLAAELAKLLQERQQETTVAALVGRIDAKNVTIIEKPTFNAPVNFNQS
jgi:hypothetical protein